MNRLEVAEGQEDGLGVWGQQIQTLTCRMDKKQGPTVEPRELYLIYPVINHNGKEYEKECISMYN